VDPIPDRVEALVELGAGPLLEAEALPPVVPDVIGRAEAPGVVHRRPATEAEAGQQPDALIRGRHAAAAEVEPGVAVELRAVEVLLAEVAAGLHEHHVEPRLGQHARGGAAAGARANDDDVAVELGVLGDPQGLDRLLGGVRQLSVRARVADRLVHRVGTLPLPRDRVVHDHRQLAQRLERRPLHDVLGVAPGEQEALAVGLGQPGEAGVPPLDQPGEPLADVRARVRAHRP
jgi:hypothetical protein